jgi:hypothetical protein
VDQAFELAEGRGLEDGADDDPGGGAEDQRAHVVKQGPDLFP